MLIAICLAYFLVILDATIVTVAVPSLGAGLHARLAELQWVVDGYTLAFAALLLTGGVLADRFGARRMLLGGLLGFGAASLACAAAPTVGWLIVARAAQGASAALMVPASLVLLRGAYDDRADRARAIGLWGAVAGLGAVCGPVLGGLLVHLAGWRAVFAVNVPLTAAASALAARLVPAVRTAGRRAQRPNVTAQMLAAAAIGAVVFVFIEAGADGLASPLVAAAAAVAVLAATAFARTERRAPRPLVPRALRRSRSAGGAVVVGLLINLGFYGQLFVVSVAFQEQRGWSALQAGLALAPEAVFVAVGSAVSGRITARIGSPRPAMLGGLSLAAAGVAALAATVGSAPYVALVPALIAAGAGMSLTMPGATTAAVEAVPEEIAGVASGVLNAARQAGSALGIAAIGALAGGAAAAAAPALVAASAAFAVAWLVTARAVPGRPAPAPAPRQSAASSA